MLDNMVVIALYIAVPATILAVAFIAVVRKEERQIQDDIDKRLSEREKEGHPPSSSR